MTEKPSWEAGSLSHLLNETFDLVSVIFMTAHVRNLYRQEFRHAGKIKKIWDEKNKKIRGYHLIPAYINYEKQKNK